MTKQEPNSEDFGLTHPEAMVLTTAYRFGPLTAYRARRMFAEAPVTSFSNSTGTVYPAIRRLTARGMLTALPVEGSRRGAALLTCTDSGREALKRWVLGIGQEELVLVDQARSKMSCFELLTPGERVDWMRRLLAQMQDAARLLQAFGAEHADKPFAVLLQDNFDSTMASRRAWAERTLRALQSDAGQGSSRGR